MNTYLEVEIASFEGGWCRGLDGELLTPLSPSEAVQALREIGGEEQAGFETLRGIYYRYVEGYLDVAVEHDALADEVVEALGLLVEGDSVRPTVWLCLPGAVRGIGSVVPNMPTAEVLERLRKFVSPWLIQHYGVEGEAHVMYVKLPDERTVREVLRELGEDGKPAFMTPPDWLPC